MSNLQEVVSGLMIDGMDGSDIADLVRNLEEDGFNENDIIEILYAIEDGESVDSAMQNCAGY